ncbi:hypothetical protein BHM03_00030795 [Ensete ventricosum]|nr:hypothetical protein BHM03_00030795 [Ensete ventricosum]
MGTTTFYSESGERRIHDLHLLLASEKARHEGGLWDSVRLASDRKARLVYNGEARYVRHVIVHGIEADHQGTEGSAEGSPDFLQRRSLQSPIGSLC